MTTLNPQKALLNLLADGQFHSGTELAEVLGISRSAICKRVASLVEFGIHLSAVNGKGYRLERPLELLNQQKILAQLDKRVTGLVSNIEIFDQISSTNSYLLEKASLNIPSGSICLAEQQTAGRGRRGRHWVSPYGNNIYLSLLWRFESNPGSLSGLSLAVGVGVIRALESLYPCPFELKWPNDIYCQEKKLGGILVELIGENNGPCTAVIGLGLNRFLSVDHAESIAQPWTDLSKITEKNPAPKNQLVARLIDQILPIAATFDTDGISKYLAEWRGHDCLKGKAVNLYIGERAYEGIVQGIDDRGMLLLNTNDGNTRTFASGEVTFRNEL